jgi:release factor glutamine methyltransferase
MTAPTRGLGRVFPTDKTASSRALFIYLMSSSITINNNYSIFGIMNSQDLTINAASNFLSHELSAFYSSKELSSLARIILKNVTSISRVNQLAYPDKPISSEQWDKIKKICVELKQFKPIQYILGKTEFYGHEFRLNKHILIPRQETEELVDLVINENRESSLKIIDIGTGSGCIAVTLAKHMIDATVFAIDISKEAIKITRENASLNKVNLILIRADIQSSSHEGIPMVDLIISNPPYVLDKERLYMSPTVLDYEPQEALFVPDEDPLIHYKAILLFAEKRLRKRGRVYFEINETRGPVMKSLLNEFSYQDIMIIKDINGKNRIVSARKNGK